MALNLEKFKAMVDQMMIMLSFAASLSSVPWDDKVVAFVKMAWNSAEFQAFWKSVPDATETETGQLVVEAMPLQEPSPEMLQLFDKFKAQVGEEKAGSISELLGLLFEAISWFKAFQKKRGGGAVPLPA